MILPRNAFARERARVAGRLLAESRRYHHDSFDLYDREVRALQAHRECLRWARALWLPVDVGNALETSTVTVQALAAWVASAVIVIGGAALLLGGVAYGLMLFGANVLR